MTATTPPYLQPGERVVLFDGTCRLCNRWVQFLLRYDHQQLFRLASVQSDQGQALLVWGGLPGETFDTLVYIDGTALYVRSEAVLRILARLPAPWRFFGVLRFIPQGLRDRGYNAIARNRYRLFGRQPHCLLPSAEHARRFLHD
jgi:predicted DCC family thiol-disulfide oxidoreductase YuxK